MKRLIKRELYTVADVILRELRAQREALIESEYQKLRATPHYKSMKKRARSVDSYLYRGESELHYNLFESQVHENIVEDLNSKFGQVPTRSMIVEKLILEQIEPNDLNQLITTVKGAF